MKSSSEEGTVDGRLKEEAAGRMGWQIGGDSPAVAGGAPAVANGGGSQGQRAPGEGVGAPEDAGTRQVVEGRRQSARVWRRLPASWPGRQSTGELQVRDGGGSRGRRRASGQLGGPLGGGSGADLAAAAVRIGGR